MLADMRENPVADYIGMIVVFLMAIGTVFIFSASANIGQELDLQRFYEYPGLRQILFFPLACLVMYSFSYFNYRKLSLDNGWLKSPISYLLILSIVLLVIVLLQRFFPVFPNLVPLRNRHFRWLNIPLGPIAISFQPSELAKWTIVFFLAAVCDKFGDEIKMYWKRFVPVCLIVGLVVTLIVVEDFGTAVLISLLAFLMLIIAGARLRHILPPLPLAAVAFFIVLLQSPRRMQRIIAFLNPDKWSDTINYQPHQSLIALGSGGLWGKGLGRGICKYGHLPEDTINYQPHQSLIALGSGGLWGKGLGRGICKYGHLPEDTTDFIFAIIGEELGLAGTVAVIGLFILFICLGILVVVRCRDRFGQFLAGGIVLTIAIQAALNIGVVTVVLPTKGMPLPFISAGGTSMLLSSAAVGILLNIARQSASKSGESDS